ncbi:hypothetical protein [Streptomyces sp. NPDC048521]|uniref:hypothetical protein n=1 Tax=Streptomyces sp. NPDC048521 TaxID=3365566 RepID=UPI003724ADCB
MGERPHCAPALGTEYHARYGGNGVLIYRRLERKKFAFTEPLSFRLLPRPKNIGSIRLCRPDDDPPGWPALRGSLTRPIRRTWTSGATCADRQGARSTPCGR